MRKPTIHLNGSSAEQLRAGYMAAIEAMHDAIEALAETAPNARDYYPQGDSAHTEARQEHEARMSKLMSVQAELGHLRRSCVVSERARRARP